MKIAILSDIHSNLEALKACCRKAASIGVEKYFCLGDMIGYAADPVATLDIIMNLPGLIAVRGNHDNAALNGDYAGLGKFIQESANWTHRQLSAEHKAFIRSLPYVQTIDNITLAHASVYEPEQWQYLYDEPQIINCLDAAGTPLVFLGHTHHPKLYYENTKSEISELHPNESTSIPIYQNRRYVANVGSVGQPRDQNSAASFVIYDTGTAEITYYRVAYDFTETAAKILAANLPPGFAKRLDRHKWHQ